MNHPDEIVKPAPDAIKDEFRGIARVVVNALMMIVSYMRQRYLS